MTMNQIETALLAPAGLTEQDIADTLSSIATRQIDYADIYFQSSWHESLVLEDSIIKDGSFNIDCGVGVRAVSGEKTGFAYSDQIQLEGLKQSAIAARGIAQQGQNLTVQAFKRAQHPAFYGAHNPLESWEKQQKTELLKQLDAYIRTKEPLITEVSVSLSGVHEQILVAATDGTYAGDIRPLVRLSISVLAQKGDRRERGSAGGGGRFGYDYFLQEEAGQKIAFSFADEAIRQALVNLEAVAAPAGTMPV
ncbi:modulator of DNA gyrase family protein, partial [Vibrio cholerae CP1030(3)]